MHQEKVFKSLNSQKVPPIDLATFLLLPLCLVAWHLTYVWVYFIYQGST